MQTPDGEPRSLGRYALFGEIAAGGMATVHLGRLKGPAGFARTVAIKRLHRHFAIDPEFVRMLLDEARLASRIEHPNVVPILDVVQEEGELFLVMPYVHGESLSRLMREQRTQGRRIPAEVSVAIVAGVLHGLHAAHEARDERGRPLGIVHRDVSPQNVLVGLDGTARVLDFGIAKARGRLQGTTEGQIKGKLAYLSPEQLSEEPLDRRTDVWAAAVVLWELLAGEPLFGGRDVGTQVGLITRAEVPAPSGRAVDLSAALDEVVLCGLARKRSQRFGSARDMAVALERALRPATASELSEWMAEVASDTLRARAMRVASIERSGLEASPASGARAVEREEGTPSTSRPAEFANAAGAPESATLRTERDQPFASGEASTGARLAGGESTLDSVVAPAAGGTDPGAPARDSATPTVPFALARRPTASDGARPAQRRAAIALGAGVTLGLALGGWVWATAGSATGSSERGAVTTEIAPAPPVPVEIRASPTFSMPAAPRTDAASAAPPAPEPAPRPGPTHVPAAHRTPPHPASAPTSPGAAPAPPSVPATTAPAPEPAPDPCAQPYVFEMVDGALLKKWKPQCIGK
jgi:serine/threonine-protein kinase